MPVYKDGKQWYFVVSYTDNFGKYRQKKSKRFNTKNEAIDEESKFRINIGTVQNQSFTFKEIVDEMLEELKYNLKPRALDKVSIKCEHVCKSLGNIKINKLTHQHYKQFINDIRKMNYSVSYSNDILSMAKRIVNFSNKRYGITTTIPFSFDNFKDVNAIKKEYNIYTIEEFNQFIKGTDEIKWIAFFNVLFYVGLRCGEANALKWTDIDFEKKTININKSIDSRLADKKITTPKTKSSYRVLPIGDNLVNLLQQLKDYWKEVDGFSEDWFVFGGYVAFPNNTIQTKKKAILKQSNALLLESDNLSKGNKNNAPMLKEIRIHDFRHSFASLCINELKLPITSISKYLGHENPSITLSTYSHFYQDKLEEMATEINNIQKNSYQILT